MAFKVHLFPPKSEQLALAQAATHGDDVEGLKPIALGRHKETLDLFGGEVLGLLPTQAG
jgi:hypothetical protein